MVMREGIGVVEPTPIRITLEPQDVGYLTQVAMERNKHRGYARQNSAWRQGFANNPSLIGLAGEWAFQSFLHRNRIKAAVVDDSLNKGDGGIDASIAGHKYQVKTSQKCYPTLLIRRVFKGRMKPLVSDRFVFCQWAPGQQFVRLRGWTMKTVIVSRGKIAKGKRGNEHYNNELDSSELKPMADLAILIKEELRGW